jgi:transposase
MKYKVKHNQQNTENAELQAVLLIMKINRRKQVDRRLKVIRLYLEGCTNTVIASKTGYTLSGVGKIIKTYHKQGLCEFARHKYGGNNQALSYEQEAVILAPFFERAAKGELVTGAEIKKALDEIRGKDTGRGYIYMLLERHGWSKTMPRPAHPKKATPEEIDSSKKLT